MSTKKVISIAVTLTLIMNLILVFTAYAAESDKGRIADLEVNIDTEKHNIQVVSLDITIPAEATSGYTIKYIDADPNEYTMPYGFLRFRVEDKTTGKIATYATAENADYNGVNLNSGERDKAEFTPGKAFELLSRLNRKTGTVDYYIDGEWFYRQWYNNSDQTIYPSSAIYPWRVLLVRYDADSTAAPTVALNYSMGLEEDEITASVRNADESKKTVTVDFTENVSGNFAKAQLRCVNGGASVALSSAEVSGSSVTFTYTDALAAGNEYALILPDDIKGEKYGNPLSSYYLYFTTAQTMTETVNKEETFDKNYNESSNLFFKDATTKLSVSHLAENIGKDGTNGLSVNSGTSSNSTENMYLKQYPTDIKSAETQIIEFDIKPLRDDLSAVIFLTDNGTNTTPLIVGFSGTGNLLAGHSWDYMGTENEPVAGTYTKDTWYNVKITWDSVNKKGFFQILPENSTLIEQDFTADSFGKIADFLTVVYKGIMGIDTTTAQDLFIMDNVKFYGLKSKPAINSVRFNDTDGNTVGAFDKLGNELSSVDVTFSNSMPLTDQASENIKLYYGDTAVTYTAVYNTETNCYSMTPTAQANIPGKNYRVTVEGLTSSDGIIVDKFECYAETDIFSYIDTSLAIVDASGEDVTEITPNTTYTLKASFESTATGFKTIPVIIAQYSEGNYMNSASVVNISSDSDIPLTITDSSVKYTGIYIWYSPETILPMCEPLIIPVTEQ